MFHRCKGIMLGWTSPAIYLLTSSESPLPSSVRISMEQASWIASLMAIGGFIGNIFFGYVASKFGRKGPLIFLSIPMIVSHFIWIYPRIQYNTFDWKAYNFIQFTFRFHGFSFGLRRMYTIITSLDWHMASLLVA